MTSHSIWDGSGWLTAEAMGLAGPAPLCTEKLKGQAQVGWTPTGLCQTQALKHAWEAWDDAWAAVPTGGPLGVWLTWVALPAQELNQPLYLGMALFDYLNSENSGNPANQ